VITTATVEPRAAAMVDCALVKSRAVAIVVRDDAVLLMHRVKPGEDYYTLPGGEVEEGETPEQACVRELLEEADLAGTIEAPAWVFENRGRVEHYFLMGPVQGTPRLGEGPEVSTPDNVYELVWVRLREVAGLNLLPARIRHSVSSLAGLRP
jgi:8-oxo-dGTP diphosphatase